MPTLKALVLVALSSGVVACAGPMRSVTHISSWSSETGGDYFYVAYAENEYVSRVKLCHIHDDNSVSCVEQPEVDRLLNP